MRLSALWSSRLPDRLHGQAVGAEDEKSAPDPRQHWPRDLDRDQGSDHGAHHSPTAHQERRLAQHVPSAKVGDAADDRRRDDRDQRRATR